MKTGFIMSKQVFYIMLLSAVTTVVSQITDKPHKQTTESSEPALPPQYVYQYDSYVYDYNYGGDTFQIDSASCQAKTLCGGEKSFIETNCYCDSICNLLDDCCANHVGTAASILTQEQFQCVRVNEIIYTHGYGVHVVTKCAPDWVDTVTKELCENNTESDDIFLRLPVSDDSELRIMYRNMYCAQCNNIDNIYYWDVKVKCRNETTTRTLPGMDECNLFFIRPRPEMEYRICKLDVIDTCDDVTYTRNCTHGQFYLMYDSMDNSYRNEYCAYCHGMRENLTCEPPQDISPIPTLKPDDDKRKYYSYRFLVDFNAGTVEDIYKSTNTSCASDEEIFDIWTGQCRKIFCAPSFMLVNRKCVKRQLSSTGSLESNDRTSNCTLIKLDPQDYELINSSTLLILSQNKIYTDADFLTNGTVVIMCSDKFLPCVDDCSDKYVIRFDLDDVESYMSLVGTLLSIVSLTITLIVYVAFPQLMNIPGKILICLVISLAVAQLFFLIAPLVDDIRSCCIAVAVLVHYSFLSAFCWMNVIAIDLWMTFSNKFITPGRGSSRSKRFMFYSLYAWLAPMFIVATALIVNSVEIDPDFDNIKPHYGRSICWITTKYGLLLYFVGPLAVFKIIDITSFIFTSIHIARAKREGAMASQKKNVCSLLINIKLSLVMGLTWVFAYIALVVNIDVMWYLFIIFNSLQGLFIALCFLCTKKVCKLLRAKFETLSTNITSKTQTTSMGNENKI